MQRRKRGEGEKPSITSGRYTPKEDEAQEGNGRGEALTGFSIANGLGRGETLKSTQPFSRAVLGTRERGTVATVGTTRGLLSVMSRGRCVRGEPPEGRTPGVLPG